MSDVDRRTGEVIDNFQSALQSVEIILTTRIGDVCMLREFGAGLVELLGKLMSVQLFVVFQNLVATAIDLWEPRFSVRRVIVNGSIEQVRRGNVKFILEVDYRPRGQYGDFTVESIRQFGLSFGRGEVLAATL